MIVLRQMCSVETIIHVYVDKLIVEIANITRISNRLTTIPTLSPCSGSGRTWPAAIRFGMVVYGRNLIFHVNSVMLCICCVLWRAYDSPFASVDKVSMPWLRPQMEIFSALLALCAGNSSVTAEFPAQRPVTRGFGVFFDLRLNKRLSKQSWRWWFETPSCLLWRYCNGTICICSGLRCSGKT